MRGNARRKRAFAIWGIRCGHGELDVGHLFANRSSTFTWITKIQAQDTVFVTEGELSCKGFFFFLLFLFFLGLVEDVAGKASSDSASLSRGFRFNNDSLRSCGGRSTRDVGAGIVENLESTGSVMASREIGVLDGFNWLERFELELGGVVDEEIILRLKPPSWGVLCCGFFAPDFGGVTSCIGSGSPAISLA